MFCSIFGAENSFDKSIFIYQTTRRYIPEDVFFIATAIRAIPHLGGSD
jgi:hypothetical protein